MARPRISLTMIVRNEENNLRPCLGPVAELFDEMVVVDTGSTDATKSIAGELGARVFDFAWCDDFSAARNESLRHASGDWIFWLDADDRIDAVNRARLKELLAKLGNEDCAYMMSCVSLPEFATDSATVIPHCRLFRRHPEIRWRHRVHEQIVPEGVGHRLVVSDVQIHHLGYQDPVAFRRKANRDLRLLRLQYATNPSDPATLFFMGATYMNIGQPAEALTWLLGSLKHSGQLRGDWMRRLYDMLAEALLHLGRREEAQSMLMEGLSNFPDDPCLLTRLGVMLVDRGELGAAERCLLQLLRKGGDRPLPLGRQNIVDLREGRYVLGQVYRGQGRMRDAERVYQELLAQYPDLVSAWVGLGYVYLDERRFADAHYVAHQLEKCPCGAGYAAALLAESCLAQGDLQRGGEHAERAVAEAPRLAWARIVRVEWLVRSGAPLPDCLAACRDVLRLAPGNAWATDMLQTLERRQRGELDQSSLWFTFTT